MIFKLLIAIFFSLSFNAEANLKIENLESILLEENINAVSIAPMSYVYIDEKKDAGPLEADDFFKKGLFKKEMMSKPNYGFTPHAYWYRFKAKNISLNKKDWFLGVEYPLINHIHLYIKEKDGNWKLFKESGISKKFSQREISNRIIYLKVAFDAVEEKDFLLRLQTDGAAEFDMRFKDERQIYLDDHDVHFFLGICCGMLLILGLYYILLGFKNKEKDRILLGLFLLSTFFVRLSLTGLGFEYIWGDYPEIAPYFVAWCVPFSFALATINAHQFLPLKEYPIMKWTSLLIITINSSFSFLSFFLPYRFIKIYTVTGLICVCIVTSMSINAQIKGFKPARYFTYAWLFMILGSVILSFQKLGIIPISFFSLYGQEIGSIFLTIFLSFGVSAKIKGTNKKLARAQKEAIFAEKQATLLQEMTNNKLEDEVIKHTKDLWKETKSTLVMLEHINEGICTIDCDGKILPQYSLKLESILEKKHLPGQSIFNLIFDHSNLNEEKKSILKSAVYASIDEFKIIFETNAHLFPKELELNLKDYKNQNKIKYLEIDWIPIENKDLLVEKILLSIKDLTEIKKAEKEVSETSVLVDENKDLLQGPGADAKDFILQLSNMMQEIWENIPLQEKEKYKEYMENLKKITSS